MPPRHPRLVRDVALIVIGACLLYLVVCLGTHSMDDPGWFSRGSNGVTAPLHNTGGPVGAWIADLLVGLMGYAAWWLPFVLGAVAWMALYGLPQAEGRAELTPALRLTGMVVLLISSAGLFGLRFPGAEGLPEGGGGILGKLVANSLKGAFGEMSANLFLIALLLVSMTLATGLSWLAVMDRIGRLMLRLPGLLRRGSQHVIEWKRARGNRGERFEARKIDAKQRARREPIIITAPALTETKNSERARRERQLPMFIGVNADGAALPPLSLLDIPKPQPVSYDEKTLEALSRQIELKLRDFRIEVEVKQAQPGPVITRFELEPAPGIKVSQINSLDKDIARGLSVKSVRVVDVIPGK